MKISKLKSIIDQIVETNKEDYDVVLDIEPKSNGEYLVDIGEIYVSNMHEGKVKIEPIIELDTHKLPMRMKLSSNMAMKIIEIRCPKCNKVISGRDKFCKYCGQPLYTREETHDYLVEESRKSKDKTGIFK